jgi:hypothetical protein
MSATSSGTSRFRLAAGEAIRRAPGGSALLALRRRGASVARRGGGAVRRRLWPIRPPVETPERVGLLSTRPKDDSFITGNGLAARCRYVINFDDLTVNEDVENQWWFCKSEFIEYFFAKHAPDEDFVLFSHNSDRPIDDGLRRFLDQRQLLAWFATNADARHPKLHAFPRGIANPRYRHGDGAALKRVQQAQIPKTQLFDVSYDTATFPPAREYCREWTGLSPTPRRDFEEYLQGLASSYFCIAPRGNGIDTHRAWESLYLRTIPIVTRSLVAEHHADMPIIVLDDWSEFRSDDFTPELYAATWRAWNPEALGLDRYLQRVGAIIDSLR